MLLIKDSVLSLKENPPAQPCFPFFQIARKNLTSFMTVPVFKKMISVYDYNPIGSTSVVFIFHK